MIAAVTPQMRCPCQTISMYMPVVPAEQADLASRGWPVEHEASGASNHCATSRGSGRIARSGGTTPITGVISKPDTGAEAIASCRSRAPARGDAEFLVGLAQRRCDGVLAGIELPPGKAIWPGCARMCRGRWVSSTPGSARSVIAISTAAGRSAVWARTRESSRSADGAACAASWNRRLEAVEQRAHAGHQREASRRWLVTERPSSCASAMFDQLQHRCSG